MSSNRLTDRRMDYYYWLIFSVSFVSLIQGAALTKNNLRSLVRSDITPEEMHRGDGGSGPTHLNDTKIGDPCHRADIFFCGTGMVCNVKPGTDMGLCECGDHYVASDNNGECVVKPEVAPHTDDSNADDGGHSATSVVLTLVFLLSLVMFALFVASKYGLIDKFRHRIPVNWNSWNWRFRRNRHNNSMDDTNAFAVPLE